MPSGTDLARRYRWVRQRQHAPNRHQVAPVLEPRIGHDQENQGADQCLGQLGPVPFALLGMQDQRIREQADVFDDSCDLASSEPSGLNDADGRPLSPKGSST